MDWLIKPCYWKLDEWLILIFDDEHPLSDLPGVNATTEDVFYFDSVTAWRSHDFSCYKNFGKMASKQLSCFNLWDFTFYNLSLASSSFHFIKYLSYVQESKIWSARPILERQYKSSHQTNKLDWPIHYHLNSCLLVVQSSTTSKTKTNTLWPSQP